MRAGIPGVVMCVELDGAATPSLLVQDERNVVHVRRWSVYGDIQAAQVPQPNISQLGYQ